MNGRGPIHWEVQLSEPFEYTRADGSTRDSDHNVNLDVITTSAMRAIELVLERHPQGTIYVVQRRGMTNLLMDPAIIKELLTDEQ